MTNTPRFLGITVLGDFILSEGVEAVLDQVQAAGATAVATNPTVTVPAAEAEGSFQPPTDAGSSPRLFDRPLFGKRALWVRSGPSFVPDGALYRHASYGPREVNDLTGEHGPEIGRFITSAVRRKLKVYLQLGAAQPTGLRDEDRPRLPDGSIPGSRMADTGSLASDAIHSYNRAYVEDLLGQYPDIAGFRPDWPEYPCYTFAEVFQDFSPHVERFAESTGFDFHGIRLEVEQFYRYLRSQNPGRRINNDDLRQLADGRGLHFFLLSRLQGSPGILEWLRLKAALSVDTLRHWRSSISEVGGDQLELGGHAFMPPYSLLTGFDFARAAEVCDTLSPKLYTMHWSQMVKFWADALLEANPALDEQLLVPALVNLVDLAEPQQAGTRLSDYGYPAPDEPHPIPSETQIRKIQQTMQEAGGAAPIHPLVHGYGPLEDFRRRLQLVVASGATGVWINRYGYLSDEKLAAIGEIWSSG